jgi:rare lipoprotein A (peptidoglycan hydrolase)
VSKNATIADANSPMARHKSLPFGTGLVIGNPKTGRKVAVQET